MVMDPGGTLTLRFKNNKPTEDQVEAFIQATLLVYQNYCGRYCDLCSSTDDCKGSKYCPIGIIRDLVIKGNTYSPCLSDQFDMKPVSEQFPEIEFEIRYVPNEYEREFIITYKGGNIVEGKIGIREIVWYDAITKQKLSS